MRRHFADDPTCQSETLCIVYLADGLVYELYDLTEDEIGNVDGK